jgi:hypothetical protein
MPWYPDIPPRYITMPLVMFFSMFHKIALIFFRKTLIKAFSSAGFALRSSKTTANSCASTGGSQEMLIKSAFPENFQ